MTSLLGGANPGQQHGHGGVSMQAHASSCWPSIGAASGRVTPGVQLPAPPQAQYDVHAPYAAWAGFIGCGSGVASSSHSGLSLARLQAQPPPKPEPGTQLSGEQSQQLEKSFSSSGPGLKSRGMGPGSGLAILHDSLVMPCEPPLGLGDGMSSACMPLPAGFDRVSSGLLFMDDLAEVAELDLMLPGDAVFSGL